MKAWIDHSILVRDAKAFVKKYGYYFRQNAKRISSLVEIAVYNSVVQHYTSHGYKVKARNLGPKKSFKYKLQASGLMENFSYFVATRGGETLTILHNTKIQSSYHKHIYFTADVTVAFLEASVTKALKSGRRHSYVKNEGLVTFVEVKHLVPFPEVLFSFSGLVLEFMPRFIFEEIEIHRKYIHICPMIVFTGVGSDHTEEIRKQLIDRYRINIVFGTSKSDGKMSGMDKMNKYKHETI